MDYLTMMELTGEEMELLRSYLWQDSGGGDLTSQLFSQEYGSAVIITEDDCILSGLEAAIFLFEEEGCTIEELEDVFNEGLSKAGSEILKISGPVPGLLKAERVALNVISRMSGIATLARSASMKAEETSPGTRVAGTRKTTPGFQIFEKRALMDGGALPHRRDLSSLAMLKDNHISALGGGPEAVKEGVSQIRDLYGPYILIEVEAEDIETALSGLESGADIIMFDNMSPDEIKKASKTAREAAKKLGKGITLEASGGIRIDDIPDYAPWVDVISMGSLTYGAPMKSFKMEYLGPYDPDNK